MSRNLVALTMLLLAVATCTDDEGKCASVVVTDSEAIARVEEICAIEKQSCTAQQDIRLAWSVGSGVFFSPLRCSENLDVCLFAIWHEIGHARLGDNEALADCFAAENATGSQVSAAICFFKHTTFVGGTADVTHGSGLARAQRIQDCNR